MESQVTPDVSHFISLKWKIMISVSLILIVINGIISIINYNSLENQFTSGQIERLEHQQRENSKLLEGMVQRLEDFIKILQLNQPDGSQVSVIKNSLDQQWDHFQSLLELKSAILISPHGKVLKEWGSLSNNPYKEVYQHVITKSHPIGGLSCVDDCHFYLASTIEDQSGKPHILIIFQSINHWLSKLKIASGADTGVITIQKNLPKHPNVNNIKRILPQWDAEIIGLTAPQMNFELLESLATNTSIKKAINQNNYLRKSARDLNIQFISLETKNLQYPTFLVLINDITDSKEEIRSGVTKTIITALLGILITGLFIVLSLWSPINHLTTLSKQLPLLATGNFELVKQRLKRNKPKNTVKDELDILDEAAFSLTGQLERLEHQVHSREKELEKNALFDELTGLANRRLFMDRISVALSELSRSSDQFAVLFLDLDQFKRINDSLGHAQGDQLLLEVAKRLSACVRKSDTVARLGGDEFTILLTHLDDSFDATSIAVKILEALRQPIQLQNREVIVTTSIGIAIAPENGNDSETILRNSDLAMYKAKGMGRDSYHYYTASMNTEAQELLALENELRTAIDNNEFELYYQPQIDLDSGVIVGVEALLRWNSPTRGLTTPFVFMDILEDTGLIVPLGEHILKTACAHAYYWNSLNIHEIKVAVNLSARQFNDPNLVSCIMLILEEEELDSRFLELEITESMLMDNIQDTISTLQKLKKLGLTLSIDDFGTGYSSLSYLKQFPVDVLKVDKDFVKDIPQDQSDMAITSAVLAMAHKLNLKVVAEGIESKAQIEFLKQNQCETGQGYFFSRPQTADKITQLLTSNNICLLDLSSQDNNTTT